ncbi:hypothetical protein BKA70DRAFT_1088373 [Coprinopsis sp. MPI-PUGE-AT-0042]|nr:hypothetical protein BKA70DRAFT_1088373 [Coprinopsis sp. MPI-PUGE-AT-0042]
MLAPETVFPFSSLPDEIQGHILEIAVDDNPQDVLNLTLVSRRAAAWVQPRLFREVVLSTGVRHSRWPRHMILSDLQQRPKQFLAAHLKRLCVLYNAISLADVVELLPSCTGVVDLAVWIEFAERGSGLSAELFICLNSFHGLKVLSFVNDNLLWLERSKPTSPPLWCANLKYLDLIYWKDPGRALPVPLLGYMESLTHLSLSPPTLAKEVVEEFDVSSALRTRPTLEVVLILLDRVAHELLVAVPSDIRVVYRRHSALEPSRYWKSQKRGQWPTAEEEIARRRAATSPA